MKFRYTGVTKSKEDVEGFVEAKSEYEARLKLRSMQVRPQKIRREASSIDWKALGNISLNPPIDLKGLLVFTKQFAALIDAGVAIVQCFEILTEQERRPIFKRILATIRRDLEAGTTLATALRRHPRVFSNLYSSLVEAGELSGTLEINLKRIVTQFEKMDRIRAKVKGAMIYPAITLVVAFASLMFLLTTVIPEVSKLYGDANAELPALTLQVLAWSKWAQANVTPIVFGAVGFVLFCIFLFRVPEVRVLLDPLLLRIPLFGDLIKKVNIGRFSRTMATLLSSGVPLLNAFNVCQKLIPNLALRSVIEDTAALVAEGKSMAHGLGLKENLFPPMVIHMVSIGEVTGKLDDLLDKVANIYEEEVDDVITNLTILIQPALIISVGGMVAFLLVAMYLPIFQLAEKVTGAL